MPYDNRPYRCAVYWVWLLDFECYDEPGVSQDTECWQVTRSGAYLIHKGKYSNRIPVLHRRCKPWSTKDNGNAHGRRAIEQGGLRDTEHFGWLRADMFPGVQAIATNSAINAKHVSAVSTHAQQSGNLEIQI